MSDLAPELVSQIISKILTRGAVSRDCKPAKLKTAFDQYSLKLKAHIFGIPYNQK